MIVNVKGHLGYRCPFIAYGYMIQGRHIFPYTYLIRVERGEIGKILCKKDILETRKQLF